MKDLFASPFFAIVRTEVRFNLKRIAPYALAVVFVANAVLWWGWGPAISRGWAVNSDFFIVWLYGGFSFLTLPIFIAVMMGDPVTRDQELEIAPLILAAPVSRAQYIGGKFAGNFLTLVGCQACFALALVLLQIVARPGMIVQSARTMPYATHFVFFVVISSLLPAAIYFAVGTLTRNVKLVYGLAVGFYPGFIGWQLLIKSAPVSWRIWLDPVLFNYAGENWKLHSAEVLNRMAVTYDRGLVANRTVLVLLSLAVVFFTCRRFSAAERDEKCSAPGRTVFDLTDPGEELFAQPRPPVGATPPALALESGRSVPSLPQVERRLEGWRAAAQQFLAAAGAEIRLLRSERSLLVILPLLLTACVIEIVAFQVSPDPSFAAVYAARIASTLLLFLFGIAVFYTGEAWHRERATKLAPVLWSTPTPDLALLLAKASGPVLISVLLMILCTLLAVGVQLIDGNLPVEPSTYFIAGFVILLPGLIFMIAASLALNVFLRDRYLVYIASLAMGGALYLVTALGHTHWVYNPVLLRYWNAGDLGLYGPQLPSILLSRLYTLGLSVLLIAAALWFFKRKARAN